MATSTVICVSKHETPLPRNNEIVSICDSETSRFTRLMNVIRQCLIFSILVSETQSHAMSQSSVVTSCGARAHTAMEDPASLSPPDLVVCQSNVDLWGNR